MNSFDKWMQEKIMNLYRKSAYYAGGISFFELAKDVATLPGSVEPCNINVAVANLMDWSWDRKQQRNAKLYARYIIGYLEESNADN